MSGLAEQAALREQAAMRRAAKETREAEFRAHCERNPGATAAELAEALGMSRRAVEVWRRKLGLGPGAPKSLRGSR